MLLTVRMCLYMLSLRHDTNAELIVECVSKHPKLYARPKNFHASHQQAQQQSQDAVTSMCC